MNLPRYNAEEAGIDYYDPEIDDLEEILADMPDVSDNMVDLEKRKALIAKHGHGNFQVEIDSIEPEGGPTSGSTRVLVRGGPFYEMNILFPKPKCKFGKHDLVVDATYVMCT